MVVIEQRDLFGLHPVDEPPTVSPGRTVMRTGTVLMNNPTIASMPGICGGRPETVAPNTTSVRPVSAPSTTPQAVCTRVLTVTPRAVAVSCSRTDRPVSRSRSRSSEIPAVVPGRCCGASRVGSSTPARARR
ncbi:hypothetical protein NJ76_19260 [Rhodococcus sp. IITR03]|nr:hypothetical protein NJ76_19260 [Rhodococcus sp. IITR03]